MYSPLFFPFLVFIIILSLIMWQLVVGYRDAVQKKKSQKTFVVGIVVCGIFLLFFVVSVLYILYESWKQSQQ